MPQFDITSPDGRKFRVTAPDGATQEEVLAYAQQNMPQAEPAPKKRERSFPEQLLRQGGLAVRHGVQGLGNFAGIFTDPFQNLAGGQTLSGATKNVLDWAGLPKPETPAEEISRAGSEAIAGGGPILKGAQLASTGIKSLPFVKQMLTRPTADAVASLTGGVASESVRQSGGPEWAAMVAGGVAPVATGAAANVAGRAGRGSGEIFRPMTKRGQEQIAADVLGRLTQDKVKATANLAEYNAIKQMEELTGKPIIGVPGSKPTSGAVAGDYGLLGGQQLIERGDAGPMFATQRGINNEARIAELSKLRATDAKLAEYVKRRDEITAPMREKAFANTKGNVNTDVVLDEIFRTFRKENAQGADAQKALDYIYGSIEKAKSEGRISPSDLYNGLYKDLNQLVGKGIDSENGRLRLAAGVATGIKNKLADAIEDAAPGFRKYLNTYSRLSRPIERIEFIKDKLGGQGLDKVSLAVPSIGSEGPQFTVSQAKFRNAVGDIEKNTPVPLAPYQKDVLGRVAGDLNSAEFAARGGKLPGSDTYQNIASANLVNRILGQTFAESGVGKQVRRPFNFLYRPVESDINDKILAAFQNPEEMEKLLRIARTSRAKSSLAGLLGDSVVAPSTAGILGSLLAQ